MVVCLHLKNISFHSSCTSNFPFQLFKAAGMISDLTSTDQYWFVSFLYYCPHFCVDYFTVCSKLYVGSCYCGNCFLNSTTLKKFLLEITSCLMKRTLFAIPVVYNLSFSYALNIVVHIFRYKFLSS